MPAGANAFGSLDEEPLKRFHLLASSSLAWASSPSYKSAGLPSNQDVFTGPLDTSTPDGTFGPNAEWFDGQA